MAVLIEATSVLVRLEAVREKFPGGWAGFQNRVPNKTLCSDDELARIGFMSPGDTKMYVEDLERCGLVYLSDGEASDIVVADQLRGPLRPCPWIEFGRVSIEGGTVAACRLKGSRSMKLFTPDGWSYQGSLSQTYGFVPNDAAHASLKFVEHREGFDIYLNRLTGKEVYTGRIDEPSAKLSNRANTLWTCPAAACSMFGMTNLIVWDIETVPDLKGFAAMSARAMMKFVLKWGIDSPSTSIKQGA
jgi:hypothetical protein